MKSIFKQRQMWDPWRTPTAAEKEERRHQIDARQSKYSREEPALRESNQKREDTKRTKKSLAWDLYDEGRYKEVEPLLRELAQQGGDTLEVRGMLSVTLSLQGKHEEAEKLGREVVRESKTMLGARHRDTMGSTYSLARILITSKKYSEAGIMLQELVKQQEEELGAEYPDTLDSKYWMARTLYARKKYSEAEGILKKVLRKQEKRLGEEHSDVLDMKFWLARTLSCQQKPSEAEPIYRTLLAQQERVLGAEHEDTMETKFWLGSAIYSQEKYSEAEPIYRTLLEQQERVLGAEHADALNTKYWLGTTIYNQQRHSEAEPIYQTLLAQQERVLGTEHADTLSTKYWLGSAIHNQNKFSEAEPIYQTLLAQQERVLGTEHADTLSTKYWLGSAIHNQNKFSEAEPIYQTLLAQQERVLGTEHADTLNTKYWLVTTIHNQNKFSEAEPIYQTLLAQQERVLGTEHADTLNTKYWLGTTLYSQQKYSEAWSIYQSLLAQQEKTLGAEHTDTLNTKHWLGTTLFFHRKPREAKLVLQEVAQEYGRLLGPSAERTLEVKSILEKVQSVLQPSIPPTSSSGGALSRLQDFFIDGDKSRTQYSDSEISQISRLLYQTNPHWGKIPRTYIVLRNIECLSFIDAFIDAGFSDYWFPVSERSLPRCLSPSQRLQFATAQSLIMTKAMDLEKGEKGHHCRFKRDESIPFEEKGILGSGGFGQVDRILSLISFREYARKRVDRRAAFGTRRAEDVKRFIDEIVMLKRLKHLHVVEFVGSYTDPKHIALIMTPVADMDLNNYLLQANAAKYGELRSFFGCLARALAFLHEQGVRHKDIKPGNILIHRGKVLFTDFGLSFDFTEGGSTTVSMVNGMTPRYCAPEVAQLEPRNTASDIWSLGVVFLEMATVLKGRTVESMYDFLKGHGSQQEYVRTNPAGFVELVSDLRGTGSRQDNAPLGWTHDMLVTQGQLRPTAAALIAMIINTGRAGDGEGSFCGICCVRPDDDLSDEFDDLDLDDE